MNPSRSRSILFAIATASSACLSTDCRAQDSIAPPPPPGFSEEGDKIGGQEKLNRLAIGAAGGIAGYSVLEKTGATARHVIHNVPKIKDAPVYGRAVGSIPVVGGVLAGANASLRLKDLPVYGKTLTSLPGWGGSKFIGRAVAAQTVPTSIGGMPYVGSAVNKIPVIGPSLAGPPNPILVGVVSYDTFVAPKYAPCGYNSRGILSTTDFNSPPRLRQYVNYLAPLPYTHPPIYSQAVLNPGETGAIPQEAAAIGGGGSPDMQVVNIP